MTGNEAKAKCPLNEWSLDISSMIRETVSHYKNFVRTNGQEDQNPKSFRDYHVACRSALAHLEQLIKLSNWAGEGAGQSTETGVTGVNVDRLVARARAALESGNTDGEEDG